jgi:hypothetical protein
MNHPKRGLAAVAALSLSAAGLATVAVAPTAQAAPAAPASGVLTWEISQQFDDHLSTHVLGGGATEAEDGVITFPGGQGTYDPDTHVTSVAYDGSVAGSFAMAGTTYYTVTVADPIVTVDAEGEGQVTAVVSASNAAAGGSPAAQTQPARVVVTTFESDAASWTEGDGLDSLTEVPDWAGVLPADSQQATDLGIGAGKPVDGKAFNPAFLANLTSGVRAHFYASGSGSDPKKAPASFTAQVAPEPLTPTVQVATTSASYSDGLTLQVSGTDFTGVTNPGDNGVYAGLAVSGELPDTSSQESMDLFAAAAWVPASAISDGSFATTLTAPTAKLDRTKSYSVYTWQAHSHSNTSQDTETPVSIDWSKLAAPVVTPPAKAKSTVASSWVKKPTTKKAGRLTVAVRGAAAKPTGRVTVQLVKAGKVKRTLGKALAGGRATFALPRLAAGAWKVRIRYVGSAAYLASAKTLPLKVRKAGR